MKLKTILLVMITAALVFGQGRNNRGRMMTWDEDLNLTTEQMQQITQLRESMQTAMMQMRQNLRSLQLELRQLQNSDTPDAQRLAELQTAIQEKQTAINTIMTAHRDQIRSLLTPDQQVIFDQHNFGSGNNMGNRRGMRGGNRSNQPWGDHRRGGRWQTSP